MKEAEVLDERPTARVEQPNRRAAVAHAAKASGKVLFNLARDGSEGLVRATTIGDSRSDSMEISRLIREEERDN